MREDLRERVASITLTHNQEQAHTILPGVGAVLGVQLRGQIRAGEKLLSSAGVTGIQPSARRYEYLGETTSVLVRFTPQGATCLGAPASALFGQSLSLDDLLPPEQVRTLTTQLQENPTQALFLVESFLARLPFTRDRLISRALSLIEANPGQRALVSSIAKELSISERQLERRFLHRVGVTPIRYAALRRFERSASHLTSAASLTSAALEAGYYDQSHFIREFRRFAGTTPGDFLRAHP